MLGALLVVASVASSIPNLAGRFLLYGITAALLGLFSEAHHLVQTDLRALAATDPLTKVANVSRFYEELGLAEAGRGGFALMVIDIDDLKKLNDVHGHQAGSDAIQALADVLRKVVRSSDCVARFGGDEFVVILHNADRTGARIVATRLKDMMAQVSLPRVPRATLTVSVGVALFGVDGTSSDELLGAADRAMYKDKRSRKAA